MRRAPFVIGATVLGLLGVITYRYPSSSAPAIGAPKSQVQTQSPTTLTTTAPPPAAGPSPTTSAPPPAGAVSSYTGPNEQYGYGTLAVKVTVSGTKITDVAVQNLQTAEQYSQQLAAQIIPMLRSQVLQAQSAKINGISGATYTSEAYATSLQAALTHLHI